MLAVAIAAIALLIVLLQTVPRTIWEYDELLFSAGVVRFDPLQHHPHPPGFPVYIGLGKLAALVTPDPFAALVLVGLALTMAGFVASAFAFRHLLGDRWLALTAALLFFLSAGMIVDATLALSDAPAVALFACAVFAPSRPGSRRTRDAVLLGLFGSLAIGCRPQLAVIVVPFLALVVALDRSRGRTAAIVATSFGATALAWFLPLVAATGGWSGFVRFQLAQASEVAAHDAQLARNGWSWAALALRFVAHPWGPKAISTPVLACAVIGLGAAVRRRDRQLAPLVVSAAIYLAFAMVVMDPSDGVRYALPATLVVALLAARGVEAITKMSGLGDMRIGVVCAGAVGVLSFQYVAPLVVQRHRTASPPVQAAAYAERSLPADAVILFDRPLAPHARQLFAGRPVAELQPGFGELAGASTPVFALTDGASDAPGAASFSWTDSDVYGKLTRNHYRIVSLVPIPRARRYEAVAGVFQPERTVAGEIWRWLAPAAEIALPDLGAAAAAIRLGLPADYPWSSLQVTVRAGASAPLAVAVDRGGSTEVVVGLPHGRSTIAIASERAYVPADFPALRQRDRRVLGVMLFGVEQRTSASALRSAAAARVARFAPMHTPAAGRTAAHGASDKIVRASQN